MQAGYLFLALFAITLFVLYIAIRRAWAETLYAGSIGAIVNVVYIILYALIQEETSIGQAIFAGIVAGLGFSGAVVIIATFFRTNQPSADVNLVSSQEEETDQ